MKTKHRILTFLLLTALLLFPTGTVYAQGPGPGSGRVLFGTNVTIDEGEVFEGDLVLFGGNVTIKEDAELNGNLVVFGGNILSSGKVDGDIVVIGGQIRLEDSAIVDGNVAMVGGQMQKSEEAKITGEVVNNAAPQIDIPNGNIPPKTPSAPSAPSIPGIVNVNFNPLVEVGWVLLSSFLMALLAMLAALFFQKRMDYVAQAVVSQPLMTGGIGLLSVIVGFALFLMVIPLVALGLAWLFGVIAIGQEVGERLGKSLRQDWTPVANAGIGVFSLALVLGSIHAINDLSWVVGCFTWILPALVGLLAIGGVVITRFGAQAVQGPGVTVYTPPTSSNGAPPATEA